MQRLLPPKLVLICIVVMVPLGLLVPVVEWPTGAWRLVGIAVFVCGVLLNVVSAQLFARIETNIRTFDEPEIFVVRGAFTRTRNPMYLGFVLMLGGIALLVGGVTAWVGPVGFFVAANWWYIPFEEGRLDETFGADYLAYRRQIPRWVGVGTVRRFTP